MHLTSQSYQTLAWRTPPNHDDNSSSMCVDTSSIKTFLLSSKHSKEVASIRCLLLENFISRLKDTSRHSKFPLLSFTASNEERNTTLHRDYRVLQLPSFSRLRTEKWCRVFCKNKKKSKPAKAIIRR